jgi:hypothetical protein
MVVAVALVGGGSGGGTVMHGGVRGLKRFLMDVFGYTR